MARVTCPARGDHRHADGRADRANQIKIIAGLGTISVHGGQQDFARAPGDNLDRIVHGVQARGIAAAVGEDLPVVAGTLRVDGDHHGLAAEGVGAAADHVAVEHGGGHDRDLVGTGQQQPPRVLDRTDPTAHRQWHETDIRRPGDDIKDRAPVLVAGGDVEEHQLIGPGGIIGAGLLHRITRVAQGNKLHALHHPAVLDVQTGDQADLERHAAIPRASAGLIAPL